MTGVRVLYVIESLSRAGAEESLAAMAPLLRSDGIDLRIAYLHERPGLRDQLVDSGVPLVSLATGPATRWAWLSRTRHAVAAIRPDLVHTTLFEADLVGRLAGRWNAVPVVSSLVNVAYGRTESGGRQVRRSRLALAWTADAATARLVRRFHALTDHVADVMAHRLLIPRSRVEVIPRGRDPVALGQRTAKRRSSTRLCLGVADDVPLVLAVGRQEWQKGLDTLLHAVPRILASEPRARFVVAGREGNETAELRRLRLTLPGADRVEFLGMRDDVPDLLAAADVLAFPSRWEGAGGTVLEAMALECPVVASDLPVFAGVLDEHSAVLVPVGDAGALADGVIGTIRSPGPARERSARARTRFLDQYTLAGVARRMSDFYARTATSPDRAGR